MVGLTLHEFELRLLPFLVVPRKRRARLHSGLAAKGSPIAAGLFQTVLSLFVIFGSSFRMGFHLGDI